MANNLVEQILKMQTIDLSKYDLLVHGPHHNLLVTKGYDRLHSFTNQRNEEGELNILSIEWKFPTIAEIYAYWRDKKYHEMSGVIYWFSDVRHGVVVSVFK